MAANSACSSGDSGVVRAPVRVPMATDGWPAAARMPASSAVTVVFPLVPVTPAISNWRDGCPKNAAATVAMAGRIVPSATLAWGTARAGGSLTSRSHTRPTAPRSAAAAAWS